MSSVAVVILNYSGENYLRQFLPQVIRHSEGVEIVVADNASTDGSRQLLNSEFPSVRLIQLDKNYGFCGGYNRALSEVDSDYYVLLNSDVEVTPGWLLPLKEVLDSDYSVAAVQPKIRSFHNKNLFEYAGAGGGFIDTFGYPFCRGRIFDSIEEDKGQYDDTTEIFWATGACMMVRASLYHQSGGLDEDFFAHMEEIDLCWRIKKRGHKIYYTGKSVVYHVGGGTLSKNSPFKTMLNFRNGLYLLLKNLPGTSLWKILLRLLLDYLAAIKFLLGGQSSHSWAVVKAHAQFVMNIPGTWRKRGSQDVHSPEGIYKGLLPWDYYARGKRSFTKLY